MKSDQDKASYDNEFRDLQVQLYDIAVQKFNGVSLFANHSTKLLDLIQSTEAQFNAQNPDRSLDNTLTIYTSAEGSEGSKISVYKSLLLSALLLGKINPSIINGQKQIT